MFDRVLNTPLIKTSFHAASVLIGKGKRSKKLNYKCFNAVFDSSAFHGNDSTFEIARKMPIPDSNNVKMRTYISI